MLLADRPPFIFIAVPKTGSSSIERALAPVADTQQSAHWNKHVLAMKLRAEAPKTLWCDAFKFAFVRNPYSWMMSWYRFRRRDVLADPAHPNHARYTGHMSFDQFVEGFSERELFLRQSDFLSAQDGALLVDFVGRYETLQADFDSVCRSLGIPSVSLDHVNPSAASGTPPENMTARSRRRINEYFARDFELFGFALR